MPEKSSNTVHVLVALVVLAALVLAGLAIVNLARGPAPAAPSAQAPAPAAPPAAVAPPAAPGIVVPVVVLDTDRVAEAVAAKVEEKAAARLGEGMKGLVAAAAPRETAAEPVAPVPPPPIPVPSVPEMPAMPPPPEGAYVTAFGAQPAVGPEDAAVLVFVLSDFQCPVCRRAAEGLSPLLTQLQGVRWVFWNNPLEMHRRAGAAAKASLAAFRQGKFWQYHDALFASPQDLEDADLERYASDLGLDLARFRQDLADPALGAQLDANSRVAALLGARGTPSFVINGRKQVGWGSAGGIQAMVEEELAAAQVLQAQGKGPAEVREARARENSKVPAELDAYLAHMLRGKVPPAAAK